VINHDASEKRRSFAPSVTCDLHYRLFCLKCVESGHVLTITYDSVRELYFENPQFGLHFLHLAGDRLLQNVARLEGMLAAERQKR
jgi:CRP-like cAMP-binding protein